MAETLQYFSYDQKLFNRLATAVMEERSIPGLSRKLANETYHSSQNDYVKLRRDMTPNHHPLSMHLEIAGLKLFPELWSGRTAAKLYALPTAMISQSLVEISIITMEGQITQEPWFFLSCTSSLYQEKLFGDWQFLPSDMAPYDGPIAVADALGGLHPEGAPYSIPLNAEDVKQISGELQKLDIQKLFVGNTYEFASYFESMYGGASSFNDIFISEFQKISKIFRDVSYRKQGLFITYE